MNSYTNDNTVPGSYTQPNSGMRGGTNAGATSGRKLEGIVSGIHGVGEQVRGQFNMAVDTAMHDREGQARNQGIIDRGREEYNTGRVIDNPEKRRYAHENYPSTGGAGGGTRMGQGTMGQGTMGQGTMGQGMMGQETMGQGRMEQGRMEQGTMGQGNMGQGRMGQGNMGQGRMGQGDMGQGRMGQETMGQGTATGRRTGSITEMMPQGVRLTEGAYGERGPTNAGAHPGGSHISGGPAVGGGHYVDESGRRI